MTVAVLHSDGQVKAERDRDTENGCQKPAQQQKTNDTGVLRAPNRKRVCLSFRLFLCSQDTQFP